MIKDGSRKAATVEALSRIKSYSALVRFMCQTRIFHIRKAADSSGREDWADASKLSSAEEDSASTLCDCRDMIVAWAGVPKFRLIEEGSASTLEDL